MVAGRAGRSEHGRAAVSNQQLLSTDAYDRSPGRGACSECGAVSLCARAFDEAGEERIALPDRGSSFQKDRQLGVPKVQDLSRDLLAFIRGITGHQFGIKTGFDYSGSLGRPCISKDIDQRQRIESLPALLRGAELAVRVIQQQIQLGGSSAA